MVCKNCGAKLYDGDRFCSKCGTRITEEAAPPAVKREPETVRPLSIPVEKTSRSKRRSGVRDASSAPEKKSRAPKVILGLLGVAIVVLMANGARLANYYHKNFSTPEEYYRWVERKAVREHSKAFAECYVNYLVGYLREYDSCVSGELRVELGEAGRNILGLTGVDWFGKGALTYESTNKDNVMQSVLGLEIGGEKLLTVDAILDFNDEAAYMGISGLSDTYLAVDTDQQGFVDGFVYTSGMEPGEYLDSLKLLETLYKECPGKAQMEALARRYLELLLDSIDDVKMRTGKTVRAENVTQTCTSLELYLDKNDIQNMLTGFLEELQEDPEVEALLLQAYDLAAELGMDTGYYWDAEEFYEAFQDAIDDILDDMDYYVTYHDELDMTIYVDNKGQIIGRTMKFPNSWEELAFSYVNPHEGNRFGYKGSITMDGGEVSITGSGKESGSRINGSFTVRYGGAGIVNVEVKDFDMKSLKKGYINGRFTLTAPSGIGRALSLSSAYSFLSDMQLVVDMSMNKTSGKVGMELMEGRELWGSVTFSVTRSDGRKISVPSTKSAIFVDDDSDFEEWWNTIGWEDFIKRLEKAGLPAGAIDTVEEFGGLDIDEVMDRLADMMWSLMYSLDM